ncbi:MAG TPA: dTDP-4-dehydrorhamnose 3,5-epimerase [Gemmatimonadales bacterium]
MRVSRVPKLPELLLFEPRVFRDERGTFRELHHEDRYRSLGLDARFVQDNLSESARHVLRGMHLQHPLAQGKLVTVLDGMVYDVAVDVRRGSPTFGRWAAVELSADNALQLWIPPGFAHGFMVLSERALFSYKCTELYNAASELAIRWDDPDIGIEWPVAVPRLSPKDATAPRLSELDPGRLPSIDIKPVCAPPSTRS